MNIKIKSSGVYCLINEDYDRVYSALKNQFADSLNQLFTERVPGYEYLQWELPGDGWVSIPDGDPIQAQEVKRLLLERQQAVCDRFGANQDMAQRVLAVPDDSYVYYKVDSDGSILIRLTAWGYRYPERIEGGNASAVLKPKGVTEPVVIRVVYDGVPYPDCTLRLNKLPRTTDAKGEIVIGDLPIGYQFDIDAGADHRHITVAAGEGVIVVDMTEYAQLEVEVTLDGAPNAGVTASVQYLDRDVQLTTDGSGQARAKLPLDRNKGLCTVTVNDEVQRLPLSEETTVFRFNFVSPEPEPEPEPEPVVVPPVVEEPVVEEPVVEDPVVEEPVKEEPVVEEPVTEKARQPWFLIVLLLLLLVALTVLTYLFSLGCFL